MGYTVKAGESWESIAGKLTGDQRQFAVIAAANGWKDLKPGMVINIPGKVSNPVVTESQMQRANQTQAGVQYGGGTQKTTAQQLAPPPSLPGSQPLSALGWSGSEPKTSALYQPPTSTVLPSTWNYKTSAINQQGKTLPTATTFQPSATTLGVPGMQWATNVFNSVFNRQAVGWTPQGQPYYGTKGIPGLAGFGTEITEWAAGLTSRLGEAMAATQPTQAITGAGVNTGVDVNALVPSPIFGTGQAAAAAIKEVGLGLIGSAARLPAQAVERVLAGPAVAINELGGAAAAVEASKPQDPGALYKWLQQNAPGVNDFLTRLTRPDVSLKILGNAISNPMPIQQKWDVAKTSLEASRMAYSAAILPARVEEFKRRLASGEDPYLLSRELESTGIELIYQSIFDPLNAVGMFGHAEQANDARRVATIANEAVPEVSGLLAKFDATQEAVTSGEKLTAMRDIVNTALPEITARVRGGLTALSEDIGIASLTANGKRSVIGDQVADVVARAVAGNGYDKGADVLTALYKLTADDPAQRLEAIDALAKLNMGTLPYSEKGIRTSVLMRDALETAGGPDAFIKSIEKAQKSESPLVAILDLAQKTLEPAVDRALPTVADRLGASAKIADLTAAGKEVPAYLTKLAESSQKISPAVRALASFDAAAKGPYLVINRFFASVYMGMSPAYAFRNMAQDTFVMFVDHPTMFTQGIGFDAWAERGAMWGHGLLPKSATEAFGALGAVQGVGEAKTAEAAFTPLRAIQDVIKNPFKFAREWSAGGEAKRAAAIVGYAIDTEMARVVRAGGAAIPDLEPLLKAGVPQQTADYLVSLIVDNYGDVGKATGAFKASLRAGSAEAWRSVNTLLDAKTVESLRGYGLTEVVNDALTSGSREEAIAKVQAGFKANVYDVAATVGKETTGIPKGHEMMQVAASMGEARKAGYLSEGEMSLAQMQWMANSHAMDAYSEALPPLLRRMYGQAAIAGQKDPQILANADAIMKEVDQLLSTRRMDAVKEANALVDQAWVKTRAIRKAPDAATVDTLWSQFGFQGNMPAEITTRQQLLDHLWDIETKPGQAKAYFTAVDDYNSVGQKAVRQMMDLTGYQPKVDEVQKLAQAEQLTKDAQAMRVAKMAASGPTLDAAGSLTIKNDALNAEYKGLNDKLWNPQTPKPELDAIRKRMAEIDTALRPVAAEVPTGTVHVYRGIPVGGVEGTHATSWSESKSLAETFAGKGGKIVDMNVPQADWDKAVAEAASVRQTSGGPKGVGGLEGLLPADYQPAKAAIQGAVTPLIPPYAEGATPSRARVLFEQQTGVKQLEQSVIDKITSEWGKVRGLEAGAGADKAVNTFIAQAQERINQALAVAQDVGVEARKFTLHNYAERHNFDSVLSYVYPYQFWYTRTYAKWLTRIARDPVLLADYARYRSGLESIHSNLPDWWKYSLNTNDLPGIHTDNPLFFNLEQTLNPLNGVLGVDFNDSEKRVNWWTSTIDDMGKFGPSVWTPWSMLVATALKLQGDNEAAAKWVGRLIPQTGALRAALSLITGGNISKLPLGGEYDPFVQLFAGGQEPYEMARTSRALGTLVQNGAITQAQADDAARAHSGPVWDMAVNTAVQTRAPWQMVSFMGGTGFKGRTKEDMQIDQFYSDYNKLWTMEPNLSPDEFRKGMDQLHTQYPYMDALLIGRKGGPDRDRGFAYAVLGRIPPGGSSKYAEWAHIDPALIDKFYTSKGHMETWATADQQRFMAGIADLSAVLDIPPDATKQEWTEAKDRYYKVLAIAEKQFGTDIWARADAYMAARGSSPAENAKANAILAGDPAIGQALDLKQAYIVGDPLLSQYYGGLSKIEGYFKGLMYNDIEKRLGTDVWDQWSEYDAQGSAAEKRSYWNSHPDLKQYMTIRDQWAPVIGEKIVEYANKLHDVPVQLRTDTTAGLGAEQLKAGIEGQQVGLPQMTWPQWQAQLGGSLSNLVADYALQGDALPKSAITQLDNVATQMGLTNGYVVLNLAAQAVSMP